MSTPEHTGNPPLTRRQMRDARTVDASPDVADEAPAEQRPAVGSFVPPHAPLARAADPVDVPAPPVPDASIDLGVSPLTRRQARQQERIRTASVPVITPEVIAAHAAGVSSPLTPSVGLASSPTLVETPAPIAPADTERPIESLFTLTPTPASHPDPIVDVPRSTPAAEPAVVSEPALGSELQAPAQAEQSVDALIAHAAEEGVPEAENEVADGRGVVHPRLGADLLEGDPAQIVLPSSFDQLISRSSTASGATPKSLIVAQTTDSASIVAPVAATGEVLITGTLNLPEGLGSLGHVPGTADGKEVDAVLVDGELPAHSSPTPIAASAAISTVKNSAEIIKPPAPEKGNKLMVSLAITAGVLAAALLGVLAIAIISGVL